MNSENKYTSQGTNQTSSASPTSSTSPILTIEQTKALDSVVQWLDSSNSDTSSTLTLGGYAGTGKTTLINHLIGVLRDINFGSVAICAFTGKAASVLRKKGVRSASTIHSLIYKFNPDLQEFVKHDSLPYSLIIVDEASMVSKELYDDLLSFNIPILFVGDHGQLEPVGDNPKLMLNPTLRLETIHRQALDSPILAFAHRLRENKRFGIDKAPGLEVTAKSLIMSRLNDLYLSSDCIIVPYNNMRHKINTTIRELKGYSSQGLLVPGERLMCLCNNSRFSLFNGCIYTLEKITGEGDLSWRVHLRDDEDKLYKDVVMSKLPFIGDKPNLDSVPRFIGLFDYGYAMTCHKSQGSEWDKVLVIEAYSKLWEMPRWRYTAVTRAAKELTYVMA